MWVWIWFLVFNVLWIVLMWLFIMFEGVIILVFVLVCDNVCLIKILVVILLII